MAIIQNSAVAGELGVDTTSRAARTTLYDSAGIEVGAYSDAPLATGQGFYTVGGWTVAVVAAALAANVNLMSFRLAAASSRKAYVTKLRLLVSPATVGVSAGVAGTLGLQRFTAQTPTGGTARTPSRRSELTGSASDVTDIRDSNAALTGTAPTWGTIVGASLVPLFTTGGSMEWIFEPDFPVILVPGDGLGLRTQFAMAATQTWMYSYTIHWYER